MVRNFNNKKYIISLFAILLLASPNLAAKYTPQINRKPLKIKIAKREIIWAICHPFIANKVYKITKTALYITDSLEQNNVLEDRSGGNLDAFKHAYWMALLSQNISPRKANRIGIIHEKINYREYKKGNTSQDSSASEMDIRNNEVGISLGLKNINTSRQQLIAKVIKAIKNGELYRLKKNNRGEYLDCNGQIIDLSKEKRWNKRKCITHTY